MERPQDSQFSTGVAPHVTEWNQSVADDDDTAKWTDMSRLQRTTSPSLNLLDLCLTPASSSMTSSKMDVGRLLIKSTDSSTKPYHVCSGIMVNSIYYLSSECICTRDSSARLGRRLSRRLLLLTELELDRPYQHHGVD